ncbi:DNA polymerase epsilon subunit 4 isoform X1 [Mastomys coucha]|uniref:DNA polymerase epsilon subunit 4 isoform X1 n=1 Tax=Mastomys coucha TaxID=35658 RepID=UPI001261EEA0|nr:DNA polymerase epsilon subunit 4 isoform X1 [Mastomys coucha]
MAAAAAAGSGTPREEETIGGEVAASQAQAPTSAPGGARLSRLPLARVKALVKADPDVTLAGQEAIFILARAAELFVETIAKDAYCCAQQGKRKTLQRRDLDNAIEAVDEFAFLEGLFNKLQPRAINSYQTATYLAFRDPSLYILSEEYPEFQRSHYHGNNLQLAKSHPC